MKQPRTESDPKINFDSCIRCSIACTRAGLIALVLSFFGLTLLPSLDNEKELIALGEYFSHRTNLIHYLDELPKERCWKALVKTEIGQNALLWPLQKLEDIYCSDAKGHVGFELLKDPHAKLEPGVQIFAWDIPQGPVQPNSRPLAPVNLRTLYSLAPAHQIINHVLALGDQKMLAAARSFSNEYNSSIFKWEALRYRLIREGGLQLTYSSGETVESTDDIGVLSLKWLTLTSLRELATAELPELSKYDALKAGLGTFKIAVPWISAGTKPSFLAIGIQSGLLLCTIYFLLYFYEASIIPGFPFLGTLFGAFSRTRLFRLVFLVFVTVPPISSALLTIRTPDGTRIGAALSLLILLISFLIARLACIQKNEIAKLHQRNG